MNAGRKQLSKMVKPFIKLIEETSLGMKANSRGSGGEIWEGWMPRTITLPGLVTDTFQHQLLVSPSSANTQSLGSALISKPPSSAQASLQSGNSSFKARASLPARTCQVFLASETTELCEHECETQGNRCCQ